MGLQIRACYQENSLSIKSTLHVWFYFRRFDKASRTRRDRTIISVNLSCSVSSSWVTAVKDTLSVAMTNSLTSSQRLKTSLTAITGLWWRIDPNSSSSNAAKADVSKSSRSHCIMANNKCILYHHSDSYLSRSGSFIFRTSYKQISRQMVSLYKRQLVFKCQNKTIWKMAVADDFVLLCGKIYVFLCGICRKKRVSAETALVD